jgi:hypothetical protein
MIDLHLDATISVGIATTEVTIPTEIRRSQF